MELLLKPLFPKEIALRIQNLISSNHRTYIILRDEFDLSAKMGITIHGVIGYDILKSMVIRIDYRKRTLDFYNPEHFNMEVCRKCEVFPLTIYQNKPYMDVSVSINEQAQKIPVKMLIDSGGSDALWLLNIQKRRLSPKEFFDDFLGRFKWNHLR